MKACLIAAFVTLSVCEAQPPAVTTAKASAPIDITGYWVAFVTEDWRFRMITPRKGDYQPVPLTPEARKIADAWDPAADEAAGNQCKSYGGAAIMRLAARFHITWQDDNTLKVESDYGMQTRLLHFNAATIIAGRAHMAGLFKRTVGTTGIAEGSDKQPPRRISAKERRSV